MSHFTFNSGRKTRKPNIGLQKEKETVFNDNFRLYMYEWMVDDFKFFKCLPRGETLSLDDLPDSSFPQSFKFHLAFDETLKNFIIKITFNLFDSNLLKFDICDAKLEFLNLNKKTLDYRYFVPDRESGCSKNFNWTLNEDLSNYVEKDSINLRFKLTLKSRELLTAGKLKEPSLPRSLMSLSDDLEKLSSNGLFSDLVIQVGGQKFEVHQCILLNQFQFISELVCEVQKISSKRQNDGVTKSSETVCVPNENATVFKAILQYLYCGRFTVGYETNYFDLHAFAQKYQLYELCSFLKPREVHCHTKIMRSSTRFYWRVTDITAKSLDKFVVYESPERQTVDGTVWCMVIHFLGTGSIFLSLKMVSADEDSRVCNAHTYFRLIICKPDGTHHEEREFHHVFSNKIANSSLFSFPRHEPLSSNSASKDPRPIYPGYLDPSSRFSITPDLLFDETLCVGYEIILCTQEHTYKTNIIIPEASQNFTSKIWLRNLLHISYNGDFSDMTVMVGETDFKVHKAVLSARSRVFAAMFQTKMSETLNSCVKIEDVRVEVMTRFLHYIYTGSTDVLTVDVALELYCTANKYEVLALKKECVEFIISNMDTRHACEVYLHSDLLHEDNMKRAAKDIICRNASLTMLTDYGQELMANHPELVRDVLDSLSAAYCSLPPQEKDKKESIYDRLFSKIDGDCSSVSSDDSECK